MEEHMSHKFGAIVFVVACFLSSMDAQSCLPSCQPPDCSCPRITYPMPTREIPQMVYFGFDDAVNVVMSSLYERIFTTKRKNPNGCRMKMSLFVSHQYTDYRKVKQFYDNGNEIGVHSVTHTAIDNDEILMKEAKQQKDNLIKAGIPAEEILGWRSPFLKTAGNNQPQILKDLGYEYDISLTYTRKRRTTPKPWPFTMEHGWPYKCGVEPCPVASQVERFWAVPVVSLMDHKDSYPCPFVDGCAVPALDEQQAYDFLMKNFLSYYNTTRAPFGLNMHAAWFYRRHNLKAMMRFLDDLMKYPDVYVVTVKQMLDWMRQPTPMSEIDSLYSWQCAESRKGGHRKQKLVAPTPTQRRGPVNFFDLFKIPTITPPRSDPRPARRQRPIRRQFNNSRLTTLRKTTTTTTTTRRPTTTTIPTTTSTTTPKPTTTTTTTQKPTTTTTTTQRPTTKTTTTIRPTTTTTTTIKPTTTTTTTQRPTTTTTTTTAQPTTTTTTQKPTTTTTTIQPTTTYTTTTQKPTTTTRTTTRQPIKSTTTSSTTPLPTTSRPPPTETTQVLSTTLPIVKSTTATVVHRIPALSHAKHQGNKQPNFLLNPPSRTHIIPVVGVGKFHPRTKNTGLLAQQRVLNSNSARMENSPANLAAPHKVGVTNTASNTVLEQSVGSGQSLIDTINSFAGVLMEIGQSHKHANEHTGQAIGRHDTKTEIKPSTVTLKELKYCVQGINCFLPSCFCQGEKIPNGLKMKDTPQMIFITVDGSVNTRLYRRYGQIFARRTNPNNCRARGTIFATESGSAAKMIRRISNIGAEIAMSGLHEHHYETVEHMENEIKHQKLSLKHNNVQSKGWKTPELKAMGNEQFRLLKKHNFLYDATLSMRRPRGRAMNSWPFTLDFGFQGKCVIPECPTEKFRGLWEVPSIPVRDYKNMYECGYVDGCMFNPPSANDTERFLWDNFMFNYKSNKAPFGLHLRQLWFSHHAYRPNIVGLTRFLDRVMALEDVYLVSVSDIIQWMQNPVPLNNITTNMPWNCS